MSFSLTASVVHFKYYIALLPLTLHIILSTGTHSQLPFVYVCFCSPHILSTLKWPKMMDIFPDSSSAGGLILLRVCFLFSCHIPPF